MMVKNAKMGSKLSPAFRRPYKIIRQLRNDRYVVADVERCQVSQKPYQGTWEAANMKSHGVITYVKIMIGQKAIPTRQIPRTQSKKNRIRRVE